MHVTLYRHHRLHWLQLEWRHDVLSGSVGIDLGQLELHALGAALQLPSALPTGERFELEARSVI